MKRMKFSSCLSQKLTRITFSSQGSSLPASAILKYLGPKKEQTSREKKAINIANSSQHSFVSWKAQTQQEVRSAVTLWFKYFEIMDSWDLGLHIISHVTRGYSHIQKLLWIRVCRTGPYSFDLKVTEVNKKTLNDFVGFELKQAKRWFY